MKRTIDIIIAATSLAALLPIIVIVGIAVKLTSSGPILFTSKRVGRNNVLFDMPKFRSMRLGTPNVPTHLLNNPSANLTPIGGFLRKTSLDELPQLWSVLTGKMSIVGPRPALFNQHELIELRKSNNTSQLKPGITGWAQVNGRDSITDIEKSKLDEYYLKNKSIALDMSIIIKTFTKVVIGKDIDH